MPKLNEFLSRTGQWLDEANQRSIYHEVVFPLVILYGGLLSGFEVLRWSEYNRSVPPNSSLVPAQTFEVAQDPATTELARLRLVVAEWQPTLSDLQGSAQWLRDLSLHRSVVPQTLELWAAILWGAPDDRLALPYYWQTVLAALAEIKQESQSQAFSETELLALFGRKLAGKGVEYAEIQGIAQATNSRVVSFTSLLSR